MDNIFPFLPGNKWDLVYSGSYREHVCDHLKPGTFYRFRVSCANIVGSSQVSGSMYYNEINFFFFVIINGYIELLNGFLCILETYCHTGLCDSYS